ncbi:MAG TPA: hypothetical protein VFG04_06085 [Planctomycetaceae bacterium]|jgi:hypothetical protein|nr:hypothetical protein [Planctomycetaceae bacterium]
MRVAITSKSASFIGAALTIGAFLFQPSPVRAGEEKAAPSAYVIVAGAGEVLDDVKYLLMLTDATEQKQWKVLKDYLEVFLIGIDLKLPTRVDVVFDEKANRTVWTIPVSKFLNFRKDNLAAILTPRIRDMGEGWWKLGSGKPADFNGWMNYTAPYARIGETKDDINLTPADPSKSAAPFLARHFLLAVDVQNKLTDAAAQAKRHELFKVTRKQTLAALKKDTGEAAADFELRKKATEIEMDELEWFFTESEHALVGLTIDTTKELGRADIELTPIANTSLAQNVSQLCTKPSLFANVERSKQPSLAFQINHPLGDIRKKAAIAMSSLVRDRLKARVDSDDKRNAEQKDAAKQMIDKGYAMVESGINAGAADGFIDVHPGASGKNVFLAGTRTADGTKLDEIINMMPKAYEGATVKLNVAEESGVKIHSIEFAKGKHPYWSDFVGADLIYVGSSKETLWAAAGEGSLDLLKNAIKKTKLPAAAGSEKAPWLELIVRLKPWIDESLTQPPKKKGADHYPKLVQAALQGGDDQLSVRMTRDGNKIVGVIELQKGILRAAGKVASDFSKENLDESSQKSGGSKRAQR